MNLGCINAEHKSRIYCDAKFSFFIFKKKAKKKRSLFPRSHFYFHNTITYVARDHFASLSSKYQNKCGGREQDFALTLLHCFSWLLQLTGTRMSFSSDHS